MKHKLITKIRALLALGLMVSIIFSQSYYATNSHSETVIEIVTYDGNVFVGRLIEETELKFTIRSIDGIEIAIPKARIQKINHIEVLKNNREVWRADPNKSMYIFSPTAFPIGNNKTYFRDFQIFYPSYNVGFADNISFQGGVFYVPGMPINRTPIIFSAKYSFSNGDMMKPSANQITFASGFMNMFIPEGPYNVGIAFTTATLGNYFSNSSISFGWPYARGSGDTFFGDLNKPLIVFAANHRVSRKAAIVGEYWRFPVDDSFMVSPFTICYRFITRKGSIDVGGVFFGFFEADNEFFVFPVLNFSIYI